MNEIVDSRVWRLDLRLHHKIYISHVVFASDKANCSNPNISNDSNDRVKFHARIVMTIY